MADVKQCAQTLILEVLNGYPEGEDGTWFVEGSEALRTTLDHLSADEASHSFGNGINSIAAHVLHMTYFLELAIDGIKQIERSSDWEGSWAKQVVTDSEWKQARDVIQERFQEFSEILAKFDLNDQDDMTYAIANVGHAAYHLGAIRQLFSIIKATAS